MAPGKNKTGTASGLKILWIPGRKKQHDKGVYKPTNYKVEQKHGEKKIENWAMGGSKAQNDMAIGGGDKDDKDEITTPSSAVLPSASLGVAAINVDDCSDDSESEVRLAKCVIKDTDYVIYNVRDSIQNLTIRTKDDVDSEGRTPTKQPKNLDSIEQIDDTDHVNGVSSTTKSANGKKSKNLPSKCQKPHKEEKTVKCLYYTMMCCECTIS